MSSKQTVVESGTSSEISSEVKAEILLLSALSKKAFDPVVLRLQDLTTLTDYFLILSARSAKHVKSVAEAILDEASRHKFHRYSAEGVNQGNWALLDYGDVIVHIFQKYVREFYDLEGLWAEAPREVLSEAAFIEIEAATRYDLNEQDDIDWD